MTELTRLRLEVLLTRFVLIIAAVAFPTGAVIQQPDTDILTLRSLQLVDDDGQVVGSLSVADGEPMLPFTNHGEVCRIRTSGLMFSDHGKVASVSVGRVLVTEGTADSMSIVGAGVVTT